MNVQVLIGRVYVRTYVRMCIHTHTYIHTDCWFYKPFNLLRNLKNFGNMYLYINVT